MKFILGLFLLLTSASAFASQGATISIFDLNQPAVSNATNDKAALEEIVKLVVAKEIVSLVNSTPDAINASIISVEFNPSNPPDLVALQKRLTAIFAGTKTEIKIQSF